MTTHTNVAGTWKLHDGTNNIKVNVAAVWKSTDVWINVAGTWKEVHVNAVALALISVASIDTDATTMSPTNAVARVTFKRNGTVVDFGGFVLCDWTDLPTSTVGDGFKVKCVASAGPWDSQASADNVYTTDISADRSFSITCTPAEGLQDYGGTFTVANLAETSTDTALTVVSAEVLP